MCYGNAAKSLEIARSRLTPEQWAKFEREFDDFCVVQGFTWANWYVHDWVKWAFFQGRQHQGAKSEPVAWECASPVGERPALAFLTSKKPTVENYEEQGWRVTPLYLAPPQTDALYTMDQMREYADNFHLSRMRILVAEKEAYERHAPAVRQARDANFERLAIAMMDDEQAVASLERWKEGR